MFRKIAASAVIVGYLGICLIDAPPAVHPHPVELVTRLDPLVDRTGLWQGSWQLFAPQPKSIDVEVSARVT